MPLARLDIDGRRVCVADNLGSTALVPTEAPVLLIHGAGHDHHVWDDVATSLASAGLRTLAPDLPGHGASAGPALASIDALAAWSMQLVDALGLAQVCLGGHSMGSLIALAAAAQTPGRVARLVLIGCIAPMPVAPALLAAARDEPARARTMINKWSFGPVEVVGEAHLQTLAARNLGRMERQAEGSLAVDLAACNDWQRGLDAAAKIRCPTLLICGERDRMTPASSVKPLFDALVGACHSARMILIPGAGHSMMDEAPAMLSDSIREFVAAAP
jgi:pimeloyl-ACP methyl ester carboxylesterase